MAFILPIEEPWTSQPQVVASLRSEYADAKTIWRPDTKLLNLAGGTYTQVGTSNLVATPGGIGLKASAYSSQNYLYGPLHTPPDWPGVTVIAQVYIDSTVANSRWPIVSAKIDQWNNQPYGCWYLALSKDGIGDTSAIFRAGNSATYISTPSTLFNGTSQVVTIIGSWDKSNLYLVGRGERCGLFNVTPVAQTTSWLSTSTALEYIGGGFDTTYRSCEFPVISVVVLPRFIPISAQIEISNAHWQIFAP